MNNSTILLVFLAILIALLCSYLQYFYKTKTKSKLTWFLFILRFFSFFIVFLLLLNPKITRKSLEIEKTPLVLAIDNSASILYLNGEKNAKKCFEKIANNTELNEKFDLKTILFDSEVVENNLNFKGKQSNIATVASHIKNNYRNKKLPIILISDGNQTNGNDFVSSFGTLNRVYPILIGDTSTVFDLKINQLNVNRFAFHKNKFPVEVFVQYTGKKPVIANFSISNGNQKLIHQSVHFSSAKKSASIQVELQANSLGLQKYKAQIGANLFEKNKFNNVKNFSVEVVDQKKNIALVTSISHPDIGAFKRAIETNAQHRVSVLKPNEINNLDSYNLVILYQPNASFKGLYDLINQQKTNTFTITGTQTDFNFLNQNDSQFQFKLSNQNEDFTAGFNDKFNVFASENIGFENFPPLQHKYGTVISNGNNLVLLSSKIRGIETQMPMLSFVENQQNRKAYLFGENSWKWRSQSFVNQHTFEKFDGFIAKIIQFLVSSQLKKSLLVEQEMNYNSGDEILIKAQYFNKNNEFDEKANLTIKLVNSKTKETKNYDLLKSTNYFGVNLDGLTAGNYTFTITETNSKTKYSSQFDVLDFDVEKQFVNPDAEKMEQLATQSAGKLFYPSQIDSLIQNLLQSNEFKAVEKFKTTKTALIEWKILLLFLLLLLSIEWFVRKYNGML